MTPECNSFCALFFFQVALIIISVVAVVMFSLKVIFYKVVLNQLSEDKSKHFLAVCSVERNCWLSLIPKAHVPNLCFQRLTRTTHSWRITTRPTNTLWPPLFCSLTSRLVTKKLVQTPELSWSFVLPFVNLFVRIIFSKTAFFVIVVAFGSRILNLIALCFSVPAITEVQQAHHLFIGNSAGSQERSYVLRSPILDHLHDICRPRWTLLLRPFLRWWVGRFFSDCFQCRTGLLSHLTTRKISRHFQRLGSNPECRTHCWLDDCLCECGCVGQNSYNSKFPSHRDTDAGFDNVRLQWLHTHNGIALLHGAG